MINLHASTEFGKRIPKQRFYENLSMTPEIKRAFVEQISAIIWQNKIAPSTANISAGVRVTELEVFELRLTKPMLDKSVLQLIDREIPYHILFILTCEGKVQVWIGYKESAKSGTSAFKISAYYNTEWMDMDALPLCMEGGDIDAVYENFVRQVAGSKLSVVQSGEECTDLALDVERARRREKLQKKIDALQRKVDNEKQFNRRVELNAMLMKEFRELEEMM